MPQPSLPDLTPAPTVAEILAQRRCEVAFFSASIVILMAIGLALTYGSVVVSMAFAVAAGGILASVEIYATRIDRLACASRRDETIRRLDRLRWYHGT